MSMLFVAGLGIAVFIEFLLITKKEKSESDKILTVWIFFTVISLFIFYIYYTGDLYRFPFLLGIEHPLPLLPAVFLYLYVASVTGQLPAQRKLILLHFIPAAAMYLYLITFFILPADQKILTYRNHGLGYETFMTIKIIAIALSGIVYVTWSLLLLRKHRQHILDEFSYQDKIDLQWLRILTWGMGAIWFLILLHDDTILFGGVSVYVFLIGFFGIRQVRIFAPEKVLSPEPAKPAAEEEKEKYAKSGLSRELSDKLYQELIRLMNVEGLYKKNDLSVDDLALRLETHPNYLSQVINEQEGKNFYDFVNTYRIEEFKRLVAIPGNQQFTLLSLAYDCGFSSKSSFNRYFKKATGKTPSEYSATLAAPQIRPS